MGWFDEQVRQRIMKDEEKITEVLVGYSSRIVGKRALKMGFSDEKKQNRDAIREILLYFQKEKQSLGEIPLNPDGLEDLEELFRSAGLQKRRIRLLGSWYKDGMGVILAERKSGGLAALLPCARGYRCFDYGRFRKVRVGKKEALEFKEEAFAFFRNLPSGKLGKKELNRYILGCLPVSELVFGFLVFLSSIVPGLFLPWLFSLLLGKLVLGGDTSVLYPAAVLIFGLVFSAGFLKLSRKRMLLRLNQKAGLPTEASIMNRIFSLPLDYFQKDSSAGIMGRVQEIQKIVKETIQMLLKSVTSIVALSAYLIIMYSMGVGGILTVLFTAGLYFLFVIVGGCIKNRTEKQQWLLKEKRMGQEEAFLSGIQKIKLAGAENRAFVKWANLYQEESRFSFHGPIYLRVLPVILPLLLTAGGLCLLSGLFRRGTPVTAMLSFLLAAALFFTNVISFGRQIGHFLGLFSSFWLLKPLLEAIPEDSGRREMVKRLSGTIELNNVTFGYQKDMKPVCDNLSLTIRAGQYIAVVGKTGCGKSTLIKLLLGLLKPQKGAVYYDGKDIDKLNLHSLRQHIGLVLQNAELLPGTIYQNIAAGSKNLSMEMAWEAADLAGIAEEIEGMPMGMDTVLTEGQTLISGGQKQRILIARAIASKPKILLLDEATSALDNVTQKQITESLKSLRATRIVIAHRLSTVRECDRILVLEDGKIVEDGTYGQLVENGGSFSELAKRQLVL